MLASIGRRTKKIKDNFYKVQNDVIKESNIIDIEINKLKRQLKEKNKEFEKLQDKNSALIIENKKYEEIKEISIEHAKIIKGLIERRKYVEYIIGFFLGLIVEFLAGILKNLLK